MPDINGMFSEENLAKKDKTSVTEGQLRSVGAPPTKWHSGTSLSGGSGGSGGGRATQGSVTKKESVERASKGDAPAPSQEKRTSIGSKTGSIKSIPKNGAGERRSSVDSKGEKAAGQPGSKEKIGESLGSHETLSATAVGQDQGPRITTGPEEGAAPVDPDLTDIDEAGETDYEEEEMIDVHRDESMIEEMVDTQGEESGVDPDAPSGDEEMPSPV
jgi:hypothetical protein